jgi:undecaprenyl-diphosphatase
MQGANVFRRWVHDAVEWLGGHEVVVLLGLLVIVAGTWGFLALAGEVAEGDTQAFDDWILLALRRADDPAVPVGPSWVAGVARDITSFGGVAVIVLVTAAVVGFLALDRKYATMTLVVVATVTGAILCEVLKSIFQRPRPDVVPHLMPAHSSSFPSGHSLISAVVYLTLGALLTRLTKERRLKLYFLTVAVILTGLVGISRLYMGVHYPTDVLAGWTVGLVWATLCLLVGRHLQQRGQIEKEE